MRRVSLLCDRKAELARRGNEGHDITIGGLKYSLKTQGNKDMKFNLIHISKFMELGKGKWEDESDLARLRDLFLERLKSCDRILCLRAFQPGMIKDLAGWHYELIEIPKSLLQQAERGEMTMSHKTKQEPKPGYCYVKDPKHNLLFQLYFDGGKECKLQVQKIQRKECIVHATWQFPTDSSPEPNLFQV